MLFGKRKRPGGVQVQLSDGEALSANRQSDVFRIEFDMMVKGSVYQRRGGEVRQFGVTVRGATRLVTSGDLVDRATFEALLAAGAIRPVAPPKKPDATPASEKVLAEKMAEMQMPPKKPEEAPRRPSPPEPKPEPSTTDAAPSAQEDAPKEVASDPASAPEAQASTENLSPSPQSLPPPEDANPDSESEKKGAGPRGRVGKSRRRRGSH